MRNDFFHFHLAFHNFYGINLGFERLPHRFVLLSVVKSASEKRGDVNDCFVVFFVFVAT